MVDPRSAYATAANSGGWAWGPKQSFRVVGNLPRLQDVTAGVQEKGPRVDKEVIDLEVFEFHEEVK